MNSTYEAAPIISPDSSTSFVDVIMALTSPVPSVSGPNVSTSPTSSRPAITVTSDESPSTVILRVSVTFLSEYNFIFSVSLVSLCPFMIHSFTLYPSSGTTLNVMTESLYMSVICADLLSVASLMVSPICMYEGRFFLDTSALIEPCVFPDDSPAEAFSITFREYSAFTDGVIFLYVAFTVTSPVNPSAGALHVNVYLSVPDSASAVSASFPSPLFSARLNTSSPA